MATGAFSKKSRDGASLPGLAVSIPSVEAGHLESRQSSSLERPPWQRPLGLQAVVESWLQSHTVRPCLCAESRLEPQRAVFEPFPPAADGRLLEALRKQGIDALYAHQREAIDSALSGRHTLLSTPTASGKSLCFHFPVLEGVIREPASSALYVYPTKALARDQEQSLCSLIEAARLGVAAMVFDGDTPGDLRKRAREGARIVLTNPDMLHAGMLPNHSRWASLFQNLRYVIVDELHVYRGVFGSHIAHVLARLARVARFHGAEPVFIGATATIGNPRAHAARLFGVDEGSLTVVDQSTAPRAARRVFVYNPPLVNAELGIRRSALKAAVELARDLVLAAVPTIVFGPSRSSVEVMLKYLRQKTAGSLPKDALTAYRGGYLPEARRGIERRLRNGDIVGVVATNALELGIDIGDLQAVICVGYPGSVAALWQRFGRAGRRDAESIGVLICNNDPLDQFLAHAPRHLFDASAEEARIDPHNLEILIQHLKCACFEQPFRPGSRDGTLASRTQAAGRAGLPSEPGLPSELQAPIEPYARLDVETTRGALGYLAGHGLVHEQGASYHWIGESFPANHVSLRSVGWDNFVIIDLEGERSIAELDWRASHTMLHEQAIYQQDAEQYQVERLDYDNHKAYVRKVAPDYFTTALTQLTVELLDRRAVATLGKLSKGLGDVKVVEKVTGYKKIKFFTHENAGYGDVRLPDMQMHTVSFWLSLPSAAQAELRQPRAVVIDALRGAGAVLRTVAALRLMCDRLDLRRSLQDGSELARPEHDRCELGSELAVGHGAAAAPPGDVSSAAFQPTLYLFDAIPGGVGLAARIYDLADELLSEARQLIEHCPCAHGCPACIGPRQGGAEPVADKRLAVSLLTLAC